MKEYKARGLIINEMPIGENDKRITVYTKEYGKITAFAKGARKPKSNLLATTQVFAYCDIIFLERKSYTTIKSMELIDFFHNIRSDIHRVAYGMYFMELLDYVALENEPYPQLLLLTLKALRRLEDEQLALELIKVIYELKVLSLSGYTPELQCCSNCSKEANTYFFSSRKGGLVCQLCHSKGMSSPLEEGVIMSLRYIIYTNVQSVFQFNVSEEVLDKLSIITKEFIQYHLDRHFKTLDFLEEILNPLV
ncbi:DNA repair protein RecO [Vallitalea okinawensis]|uniref:DNA repair protein RecO n=1 Tax=Vallitalea okinawensis TaxID=2078660 RepID=UPI0013004539|nr:DNA repair protein RecO [Vallitalea okinawensis]